MALVIKILSTGASLEAVRSERVGHIELRNTVPETSNSHALVMGEGTVGRRKNVEVLPNEQALGESFNSEKSVLDRFSCL